MRTEAHVGRIPGIPPPCAGGDCAERPAVGVRAMVYGSTPGSLEQGRKLLHLFFEATKSFLRLALVRRLCYGEPVGKICPAFLEAVEASERFFKPPLFLKDWRHSLGRIPSVRFGKLAFEFRQAFSTALRVKDSSITRRTGERVVGFLGGYLRVGRIVLPYAYSCAHACGRAERVLTFQERSLSPATRVSRVKRALSGVRIL